MTTTSQSSGSVASVLSAEKSGNTNNSYSEHAASLSGRKVHHVTVCMVPPEQTPAVWEQLTKVRTMLRDPGLFRWPPHVNLLYPFVNPCNNIPAPAASSSSSSSADEATVAGTRHRQEQQSPHEVNPAVLEALHSACRQCEPFTVTLDRLGTFGGAKRGVLWLYPHSSSCNAIDHQVESLPSFHQEDKDSDDFNAKNDDKNKGQSEPLIRLQQLLEEQFPDCTEQRKVSGRFQPHLTLSHFSSVTAARDAQGTLEQEWGCWRKSSSNKLQPKDDGQGRLDVEHSIAATRDNYCKMRFNVTEIYVLIRKGEQGQFVRLATIELGSTGKVHIHDPPSRFAPMPLEEVEWVREERMKLKSRRRNRTKKAKRQQGGEGQWGRR